MTIVAIDVSFTPTCLLFGVAYNIVDNAVHIHFAVLLVSIELSKSGEGDE